jgi:hypothetical protein
VQWQDVEEFGQSLRTYPIRYRLKHH